MSVTSACVACNLVLRASWSSSVVTDMDASLALVKWNDRMEDERTTCCKKGMQRTFISEPSTLLFPIGIHLLLTQQSAKFRLRLGLFSFLESFGDWLDSLFFNYRPFVRPLVLLCAQHPRIRIGLLFPLPVQSGSASDSPGIGPLPLATDPATDYRKAKGRTTSDHSLLSPPTKILLHENLNSESFAR